jgi:hypothetical protein
MQSYRFPVIRSRASRLCSTSSSVVAQDDTLIRMAVCPCQTVPPHQQVPSSWISEITRGRLCIAEGYQYLIENDCIEYIVAGRAEAVREAPGLPAVALDQLNDSFPAQRS